MSCDRSLDRFLETYGIDLLPHKRIMLSETIVRKGIYFCDLRNLRRAKLRNMARVMTEVLKG